jgi:hypothetical protein
MQFMQYTLTNTPAQRDTSSPPVHLEGACMDATISSAVTTSRHAKPLLLLLLLL